MMGKLNGMKIGALAKKAGVNIETVRYYERRGLIPLPPRSKQEFGYHPGYRIYDEEILHRLGFIRRSKELGFTLNEIQKLLQVADGHEKNCKDTLDFSNNKILEIDNKINDLKKIRSMLMELTKLCKSNEDLSCCPIIESLTKIT